jgi:hypothetical protein
LPANFGPCNFEFYTFIHCRQYNSCLVSLSSGRTKIIKRTLHCMVLDELKTNINSTNASLVHYGASVKQKTT